MSFTVLLPNQEFGTGTGAVRHTVSMLFADVCQASRDVAATSKRGEKTARLASVLGAAEPDEIPAVVGFLTGTARQGRIGVGWASLRELPAAAVTASLTVGVVDGAIGALAVTSGSGSVATRRALLDDLFGRATEVEHEFLVRVLGGELRQGASDGVVVAAIAAAAGVPVTDVRRGAMMSGDLGTTAQVALTGGSPGLARLTLTPLRAVQPMLASPSPGVVEALATTGEASVEWKLDGARIQAHRRGDEIRLFTRNLNDITDRLSGVVELVRSLPGDDLVLDGEVLGVDEEGNPRAFQDTMGDFGADGIAGRGSGLRAFFFDVLHTGADTVIDEPLSVRRAVLESVVPATSRLPAIVTADAGLAEQFLQQAVASGHEGVMVKALDSAYDAGRRGGSWRKVKPVHTFDLVVLAAEWGHGRRTGWLSNLHLGARANDGGFVMVGKTFKGLTDDLLSWQTDALQAIALGTEGHTVHVRPELVVEIAIDGVQRSTRYPGGVALRFARVRRYRPDKSAAEADTIESVQRLAARPV
jgi:DNA ligase-1